MSNAPTEPSKKGALTVPGALGCMGRSCFVADAVGNYALGVHKQKACIILLLFAWFGFIFLTIGSSLSLWLSGNYLLPLQ